MNEYIIPFLTWAGGKRWFVNNHPELFPLNYDNYIEPFLGSGAVFFHLKPQTAILNDINKDLINAYVAVKDDYEKLETYLRKHHRHHNEDYYYKVRASKPRKPITKAAKFIYLNRTCYNGLYRVNKLGSFNVPIGTKKNVVLETDNFEAISKLLKNVQFESSDFEVIINKAEKDDFLFIDPPYTINHNENGFIEYNEKIFSWNDQERLAKCLSRAKDRGVKILITNANHESVVKLYMENEFSNISVLNRFSGMASDGTKRSKYEELIIKANY